MNFYKHHLGDYDGHTAHLSWDEDMAYTRLIRAYYRREKPFTDAAEAYRLCRALGKAQRAAIDTILAEFFTQQADGWHNKRCDEEIVKAIEDGEDNAAKRENEKERQQRHRARRKELFEALRGHGQVPAWDIPTESLQAMLNTCMSQKQKHDGNEPVTRDATANHKPLAISHKPVIEKHGSRFALTELPEDWLTYCKTERPELDPARVFTDFRDYWISVAGAKGRKADWLATWRTWVRRQEVKRVNGHESWWSTDATIMAKALELRISTRGMSRDQLKGEIQQRLAT